MFPITISPATALTLATTMRGEDITAAASRSAARELEQARHAASRSAARGQHSHRLRARLAHLRPVTLVGRTG